MHRTNLYLTEIQERELDTRARSNGMSRSAYVRQIIDNALQEPESIPAAIQTELARIADSYLDLVSGLFDDDPDLRIDH